MLILNLITFPQYSVLLFAVSTHMSTAFLFFVLFLFCFLFCPASYNGGFTNYHLGKIGDTAV